MSFESISMVCRCAYTVGAFRGLRRLATTAALLCVTVGNANAADKIFWANEAGNSLRVANLANGSGVQTLDGAAGGAGPCGVAIDVTAGADGTLYYADFFTQSIWARDLDTDVVTAVIVGEDGACGVAVNPATQTIYWAAFGSRSIRALKLDGVSPVQTLFNGEGGPLGVAIDPAGGKIYWSNVTGTIRRGNLDGTGLAQDFASNEQSPQGVALDLDAGAIYWTNFGSNEVRRASLNGPNTPETILSAGFPGTPEGALVGPFGIAIDAEGGLFYWANWAGGTIWRAPIDGSSLPEQLGLGPFGDHPNFPVLLRSPGSSAPPAISGDANVGAELTCSEGSWSPDQLGAYLFRAPHSLAYQWRLDGADISGADQSSFTPATTGTYTCRVTASNHAGSTDQTSPALKIGQRLSLEKFYDANANGLKDGTDSRIFGWKVEVVGFSTYLTPMTVSLDPGGYEVREIAPTQKNWLATTAKSQFVTLDRNHEATVEFGNVCVGTGGAMTSGFWGNRNGQALVLADDLAFMATLNLRDAAGKHFDPADYSAFKAWLGKASGTNMAYALSGELATMELNVFNGKVSGSALIQAPGTQSANAQGFATVNALMNEANVELGLHGLTTSKVGKEFRAYQASLQTALLKANGNATFVQAAPCAFTFQ